MHPVQASSVRHAWLSLLNIALKHHSQVKPGFFHGNTVRCLGEPPGEALSQDQPPYEDTLSAHNRLTRPKMPGHRRSGTSGLACTLLFEVMLYLVDLSQLHPLSWLSTSDWGKKHKHSPLGRYSTVS